VELEFENGMITVTGETGAGKSMLVDSCALALGGRADISLLRHGCDEASVEATFTLDENHQVHPLLKDLGIPIEEGELVMRRFLNSQGKTKAFVNGVRVTQTQMKEVGDLLVDIHSQYDNQLLLKPQYHAGLLDSFGHSEAITNRVEKSYWEWYRLNKRLNQIQNSNEEYLEEERLLKSYIKELEDLDPKVGERDTLSEERQKLMAGEKLVEVFSQASQYLASEDGRGVVDNVALADRAFAAVSDYAGDEVLTISRRLTSIYEELNDITREIDSMGSQFEPDPERLEWVDDRLFTLKSCARKHNITTDELPAFADKLSRKLDEMSLMEESLEDLENRVEEAWDVYVDTAKELTAKRKKVAEKLEKTIGKSLDNLKMGHARFSVRFNPLEAGNAGGLEEVEFLVSTNNSETFNPLAKIASGGEVSRLMLALKEVFYADEDTSTLIFDEVDTGVGGAVADAVGETLQKMAEKHQVMVITHLPQVAARGAVHIKIEKYADTQNSEIVTSVIKLDDKEREEEIARMLAGKKVTNEARSAATKLLGS
jgi:DNA repair protein RecN (Recombination protein N)